MYEVIMNNKRKKHGEIRKLVETFDEAREIALKSINLSTNYSEELFICSKFKSALVRKTKYVRGDIYVH